MGWWAGAKDTRGSLRVSACRTFRGANTRRQLPHQLIMHVVDNHHYPPHAVVEL